MSFTEMRMQSVSSNFLTFFVKEVIIESVKKLHMD